MIHNHWFSIILHDSQPLAHHSTPLFTLAQNTTLDSQLLAQHYTP